MNRSLLIITWSILMPLSLTAQAKLGLENYYYPGEQGGSVVPMIHFETGSAWRVELRYNYEEAKTLSFFTGKTIAIGTARQINITPMLGVSTGTFSGVSLATNIEAEWNNFYFSSQSQYSLSTRKDNDHFLFSWSELGYNLSKHLFGGLAVQYSLSGGKSKTEPGFVAGISIGDLAIPFYVFSPFGRGKYFIAGLIYECNFRMKIKQERL